MIAQFALSFKTVTPSELDLKLKVGLTIRNSRKRFLPRKEVSERHTPEFLSMQLHHCILIKLHVLWAKNATVMIVTNILINLNFKSKKPIYQYFSRESNSAILILAPWHELMDVNFYFALFCTVFIAKSCKGWKMQQNNWIHQRSIGGAPTNYQRRRRADHQKSTASAPTIWRRRRRSLRRALYTINGAREPEVPSRVLNFRVLSLEPPRNLTWPRNE